MAEEWPRQPVSPWMSSPTDTPIRQPDRNNSQDPGVSRPSTGSRETVVSQVDNLAGILHQPSTVIQSQHQPALIIHRFHPGLVEW